MADYDSSLPIRTQNDGDVVAKISDATVPSQQLAVNVDGSINITDNSGSITVDGTVELGATSLAALESITVQNGSGGAAVNIQDGGNTITVDGTVELGATSLAALESITVQNGSGGSAVNIQDGGNSITVDGTVAVSNLPSTVDTDYGAVGASTLRSASQIGNASGAADFNTGASGAQTLRTVANLNVAGAPVTSLNPVPVSMSTAIAGATEVLDFKQAASIAAAASDTHTYTVTALKVLTLQKIVASGSGKIKCEIKLNAVTKVVLFNSTSNPNVEYEFSNPQNLAAAVVVSVVITNLDKAAQDLYSSIEGYEV